MYVQKEPKYSMVLRLIPHVKALQELNLPPILAKFAQRKQGFFLVVGPVGQGKSATMSSMVGLIFEERAAQSSLLKTVGIPGRQKSIINQRQDRSTRLPIGGIAVFGQSSILVRLH